MIIPRNCYMVWFYVNGWGDFPIGKLPHIYILGNILGIQIKDNTKIENLSFYKKFI